MTDPTTLSISCAGDCACHAELARLADLAGLTEKAQKIDYDLSAKYAQFNRALFDGALPADLSIDWFASKKVGGVANVKLKQVKDLPHPRLLRIDPDRKWDSYAPEPGTYSIKISTVYQRSEQALDAILIHEMIHVFMFVTGKLAENHGRLFQEKAKALGDRVGFAIPLIDETTGLALTDDTVKGYGVVLITMKDGSKTYQMSSEKIVRASLDAIQALWGGRLGYTCAGVSVFIVKDAEWTRAATDLPLCRKFDRNTNVYRIPTTHKALFDGIEQNAEKIHDVTKP